MNYIKCDISRDEMSINNGGCEDLVQGETKKDVSHKKELGGWTEDIF